VTLLRRIRLGVPVVLACAAFLYAADKKDKPKAPDTMVDSGSFGVFVRGQRVVTETFSVQQENGISLVKSHLQETDAASAAGQKSELQMTSGGELIRYEWNDGGSSLVVTPKDEFLIEKITPSASSKSVDQPFLLPNTSAILDNNFFIHREVFAWRYLSANCHPEGGDQKCQKGALEFGVMVPQDRTSMRVRMELVGPEKIKVQGAERELLRLNLMGESFSWALWVDPKDRFKLMRVLVAADNTEVLRD
jgi:hypothetical protein